MINNEVNGFLVPVADVDMLAMRLKQLTDEPEKRSSLSSEAKKIADDFEKSKIADKFLKFCSNNTEKNQ